MSEIHFAEAGPGEIDIIAALAHEIWNEYYPSIIGQPQVDYMLGRMYSRESLLDQMKNGVHRFYLVKEQIEPIGFFSFSVDKSDAMLHKLYVRKEKRGSRAALMVMDFITKILISENVQNLRLTVNRMNIRAINFYFKSGFKIEKAADFDIGEGYFMNDFVMLKSL